MLTLLLYPRKVPSLAPFSPQPCGYSPLLFPVLRATCSRTLVFPFWFPDQQLLAQQINLARGCDDQSGLLCKKESGGQLSFYGGRKIIFTCSPYPGYT